MKELQEINLVQLIEQETGERFNRSGFIKCPFHGDKKPSMSVKFIPNANKQRYKCWSCNATGDAIDFIKNLKNMEYKEARSYLGLEVELSEAETFEEKMKKSAEYQVTKGAKKGYKFLGLFTFVDENNKPIYCKMKFLRPDGTKETPYYSLDDEGNIINSRAHEEVPYNYYSLLQGIANNKVIIPVEGEKDANMINSLLDKRKYVATSLKGLNDEAIQKVFENTEMLKIYVIGDTGEAGQKYINKIKYNVLKYCKEFKIINLHGIQKLGDNADVTDWLEAGHTKDELLNCFKRSLDLKNKDELQQDERGVYYLKFKRNEEKPSREYITDFKVIEASKINCVDQEIQGIRLKIKSCIDGKTVEKVGNSKIFDDLRTFRNFLGMDFSFMGKNVTELVKFKNWINWYWALDTKEIYVGTKFLPVGDKFQLITSTGTLTYDNKDYSKIAENTKINLIYVPEITKAELEELMKYLFSFIEYSQALSIIGSVISFLMIGQNLSSGSNLHHLLIVGESESGKSTILKKIIAPLLNMDIKEIESFTSSPFSLQGKMNIGNYPLMIDEFKPSTFDKYKNQALSNMFRIAYERQPISRGSKSFEVKEFYLTRPLIMCGEESYPGNEKANITRSCIVYISKKDRTEENSKSMYWLMNHEDLIKKLGKTLILEILNMTTEEYKGLRNELIEGFSLKNRTLNTAVNVATGIEMLNKVLKKFDLQPIGLDYLRQIENNMRDEVLDGGDDAKSTVEQMLCLYNDLLQDRIVYCNSEAIQYRDKKVYIRTQMIIDSLFKYAKDYQSTDISLLKAKDFKKQAKKAGYIAKVNARQIRINNDSTDVTKTTGRNMWFDEYDRNMLIKLGLDSIVDCEGWDDIVSKCEVKFIGAGA